MRKKYFVKLVNYIKNAYHLGRGSNKLFDKRANQTYSTAQTIMPVLFGFLLRKLKSWGRKRCIFFQ